MLVRDVMQTKMFTITPETTLPEAIRLTSQRGIRIATINPGPAIEALRARGYEVRDGERYRGGTHP